MIDDLLTAARNNKRPIIAIGALSFFGYSAGYINPPGYWPILLAIAAGAFVVGVYAAKIVLEMFPDEFPIWVIAFDGSGVGGKVYELTEEQFESMTSEPADGILMQWDSAKPTFEVRDYDREKNHAKLNWRVPGSSLAQHESVDEALEQIDELQTSYERDARRGRFIQRRLPSIVRRLDRDRAADQMAVLENHLAPSVDESPSITEIIIDELPDELTPKSKRLNKDDDIMKNGDSDEIIDWEDYDEPIGPVEP